MIVELLQKILDSGIEYNYIEVTVNLKSRIAGYSKKKLTQEIINDWVSDEKVESLNITLNINEGISPSTLQYASAWFSARITIHGTPEDMHMLYDVYGDTMMLNYNNFERNFDSKILDFDKSFKRIRRLHNMLIRHDYELHSFIRSVNRKSQIKKGQ